VYTLLSNDFVRCYHVHKCRHHLCCLREVTLPSPLASLPPNTPCRVLGLPSRHTPPAHHSPCLATRKSFVLFLTYPFGVFLAGRGRPIAGTDDSVILAAAPALLGRKPSPLFYANAARNIHVSSYKTQVVDV